MEIDDETVLWLEERSFENMVRFYHDSLMELHRTGKLPEKWTKHDRKHLRKWGVTKLKCMSPQNGVILSRRTLMVMGLK